MDTPEAGRLTVLLSNWREGDKAAADEIAVLLYDELRKLAASYMKRERLGHTLQATAIVNELYVRLFSGNPPQITNRSHLIAIAAKQLRCILLDYARAASRDKRGGGHLKLSLSDINDWGGSPEQDFLDLDEALAELEQLDTRAARGVELRFFAGLQEKEAAEILSISVATLKRDWEFARAWLLSRLMPGQVAEARNSHQRTKNPRKKSGPEDGVPN